MLYVYHSILGQVFNLHILDELIFASTNIAGEAEGSWFICIGGSVGTRDTHFCLMDVRANMFFT